MRTVRDEDLHGRLPPELIVARTKALMELYAGRGDGVVERLDGLDPVEVLDRVLTRLGLDIGSFRAADIRCLDDEGRSRMLRLLDRLRMLRDDEICRESALVAAQGELEQIMRSEWLRCVHGEVGSPDGRSRCEIAHSEVERLERELVFVRSAFRDHAEELAHFLAASRRERFTGIGA